MTQLIQKKSELITSLLYLIYEFNPKSYINGSTKLQACIFLLQELLEIPKDNRYKFYSGAFGPNSPNLKNDIKLEFADSIIQIKEEESKASNRIDYKLTGNKLDVIKDIFESYPPDKKLIFYAIRNLTFYDYKIIIGLVYNLYPEMTANSIILDKIKHIPMKLIQKIAISFFKSLPYKLVKAIYQSNKHFKEVIPKITDITSYPIKKLDKKQEEKILAEIISENSELLKILAKY
jgi:hypothetical protein